MGASSSCEADSNDDYHILFLDDYDGFVKKYGPISNC